MKRVLNLGSLSRIVEGDSNDLLLRMKLTGKIKDIQIRGTGGEMESLLLTQPAPPES